MKALIMIASLVLCTSAMAKETTTTTAFIRGNSMAEVQMKVDQFLAKIKTDKRVRELIPRECNPTNSRRVVRKAYRISFFKGGNSYTVTGTGEWKASGPSAQVKVKCTSYKKN